MWDNREEAKHNRVTPSTALSQGESRFALQDPQFLQWHLINQLCTGPTESNAAKESPQRVPPTRTCFCRHGEEYVSLQVWLCKTGWQISPFFIDKYTFSHTHNGNSMIYMACLQTRKGTIQNHLQANVVKITHFNVLSKCIKREKLAFILSIAGVFHFPLNKYISSQKTNLCPHINTISDLSNVETKWAACGNQKTFYSRWTRHFYYWIVLSKFTPFL